MWISWGWEGGVGVFIQDLGKVHADVCDSLVLQIVFISVSTEL